MAIELRTADAGSRVSLLTGEPATVRLPETPTTGYRWQVEDLAPLLQLVEDRFDGSPEPRGATGERVFVFEALAPGQVALRLVKRRAWGDTEPVEEYLVDLDVRLAEDQPAGGAAGE